MSRPTRLYQKSPSIAPENQSIIPVGGQPLPGMVRSISLPESDQLSGRGKRLIVMKNAMDKEQHLTQQSITEAPNPSGLMMERKTVMNKYGSALLPRPEGQLLPFNPTEKNSLYPSLMEFMQRQGHGADQYTSALQLRSQGQLMPASSPETDCLYPTLVLQTQTSTTQKMMLTYRSPSLPSHQDPVVNYDMRRRHTVGSWEDHSNTQRTEDFEAFRKEVKNVHRALLQYDILMETHGDTLQGLITELLQVADNLDQVFKGAKIAGITGGTAGAAGVAAAVGGVLLAPLTMGASLAVAAVGVGVAAAGGVTGASAAITNKVHNNIDRKRVEKILNDYTNQMKPIESCVEVINTGMEHLRSHDLSKFHGMVSEVVKVAKVAQVAGGSAGAIGAIGRSSGLIQGFALGMDMYFTKNNTQKLKKGSESKFAKQIREVAQKMQDSFDELMRFKAVLASTDI
ncbi:hypothetical protein AOLI_G00002840 [Acnodon oligacanthus]